MKNKLNDRVIDKIIILINHSQNTVNYCDEMIGFYTSKGDQTKVRELEMDRAKEEIVLKYHRIDLQIRSRK